MIARGMAPNIVSDVNMWSVVKDTKNSPLEGPSGSVSALDLKAPLKARDQYVKGYRLLMRKNFDEAAQHLLAAISIYPRFVAAHNALGSAYLEGGKERLARDEFATAISLDDHLPGSYLNLGCAELALGDYASAADSVRKASGMAPLDMQVATTLSYAQFMNQDYASVVATARQVHSKRHDGAALVHYYAAAAWQRQDNIAETRSELETFLREDPKSERAQLAQNALDEIKVHRDRQNSQLSPANTTGPSAADAALTARRELERLELAKQESKEQGQIAEVEATTLACSTCAPVDAPLKTLIDSPQRPQLKANPATDDAFSLRSEVHEVAVLFAATDHGKPVTDLSREDVVVLDSRKLPSAITGFRNESELPLRLGIIVDTSESVSSQLASERRAAVHFLHDVLTSNNDLAFVVGVSNSVLLVQDYTNDQQQLSHVVNELAPGGGTALWDAVSFAAQKLASRAETQPTAKLLVVISDGRDNSSKTTLKEAIDAAETSDVFVYTLCTAASGSENDPLLAENPNVIGPRAMKLLAERTGGAALAPRTLGGLDSTLTSVQEAIRSRYLISYKPPGFTLDGTFHSINISASKSGHKLRVYARKGYFARDSSTDATN